MRIVLDHKVVAAVARKVFVVESPRGKSTRAWRLGWPTSMRPTFELLWLFRIETSSWPPAWVGIVQPRCWRSLWLRLIVPPDCVLSTRSRDVPLSGVVETRPAAPVGERGARLRLSLPIVVPVSSASTAPVSIAPSAMARKFVGAPFASMRKLPPRQDAFPWRDALEPDALKVKVPVGTQSAVQAFGAPPSVIFP